MRRNRKQAVMAVAIVVLCFGLAACKTAPKPSSEKADPRDEVRAMARMTLGQLYAKSPAAQNAVMKAAGYAIFTDYGFKALSMGGAKGAGVAVNNATKQETFMRMAELQPGLSVGAQKYRVVFIFDNPVAFNSFVISGWDAGANAMAVAKTKIARGALAGAVTVSEGVYMYQLTVEGLIVGVSITGAKFYRDKELN